MEVKSGVSRLAQMQAVFQQRQNAAREQRLQQETQESNLLSRSMITERRSAGSLTNIMTGAPLNGSISTGKVRQMFDERRRGATGIDKSFPLQPLKTRPTPPTKTDYSYKPQQKLSGSTRRVQQTTTSSLNGRAATRVLRQPISNSYGYVDKKNDYNTKNYGYNDDNQANEPERYHTSPFRAEFELGALLDSAHIGDETPLDDEAFPETSLDFEDPAMDRPDRTTRRPPANGDHHAPPKPTVRQPSKLSSIGGGDLNTNIKSKMPEKSRIASKPPPNTLVKKSVTTKSPVKENPSKSPQLQSPTKVPPTTKFSASPPPRHQAAQPAASGDLVNCPVCGRNFATDRIEKHRSICQKTSQKKRKVYDALKHRVQGTDAEQFVRTRVRKNQSGSMQIPKRPPLQTNWRKKHEDFIAAIRAAKKVQEHIKAGGKLSDLPPPPPSENPDYVQCPHCGRRFNQAAAERHIPKCATMEHNKPKNRTQQAAGGRMAGPASRSTQRK